MLALEEELATDEELRAGSLLHIHLLGGFRAERADFDRPVSDWKRQSAKTLTKLLAAHPRHALHREEILEILWPGLDLEPALNSFGKALHAARRALEPELLPRSSSRYLRLSDSMLSLDPEWVVIDSDRFQGLAEEALRSKEVDAYERALHAYGGDLLPEDRYEDWCAERRDLLAELQLRLLLGLAEVLEAGGVYYESADRLREALEKDPTREEVHRRLIRVYAQMGNRDRALRQFYLCKDVLRRELDLSPQEETVSLFRDLLQDSVPEPGPAERRDTVPPITGLAPITRRTLFGREEELAWLHEQLMPSKSRRAGVILITGEAGVGKTRLTEEFADAAEHAGAVVITAGSGSQANRFTCGPFALALENYVASRPERERREIAMRYPGLAPCLPSLPLIKGHPSGGDCRDDLPAAIARMLTDLGQTQPVVLVLGDLDDLDAFSCDLLRYIGHLASTRPWLIIGAAREHELDAHNEIHHTIHSMVREGLCSKIELPCLPRSDCDALTRALLEGEDAPDEVLEQVYESSSGNPLLVQELVRQLREGKRPHGTVKILLAGLGPTTARILALAAVARGGEIDLDELRAGAAALEPQVSDAALFDALDEALQARVLDERASGYVFRHPLIRSALCDGLSRHRRAELEAALGRSARGGARRLRVAAER